MAAAEVNPAMTGFDMKVMRNPGKKKLSSYKLALRLMFTKFYTNIYSNI